MAWKGVGDWEIEEKWKRPRTKGEAREQIRETYAYNDWNPALQQVHLEMIELSGDWELFDVEKMKIILNDFENAGMILYGN